MFSKYLYIYYRNFIGKKKRKFRSMMLSIIEIQILGANILTIW